MVKRFFSGRILPAKPRGLVLGSRVCTKSVKLLSSAIFGLYFEKKFPGRPWTPDSSLDRHRLEIRPRI